MFVYFGDGMISQLTVLIISDCKISFEHEMRVN